MKTSKMVICYLLSLWFLSMALFKILDDDFIGVFKAYSIPKWIEMIISFIEIIGGVLLFFGVRNIILRLFGGIVLIPVVLGALIFHIVFGGLKWYGGTGEVWYSILPAILRSVGLIFITYSGFLELLDLGYKTRTGSSFKKRSFANVN